MAHVSEGACVGLIAASTPLSSSGTQSSFLGFLSLNGIILSWCVSILTTFFSLQNNNLAFLMLGLTPAGPEGPLLSHGP